MPKIEAARTFGVGISSVKRYVATAEAGQSLAPKKRPGSKPKLDEAARRLLEADLRVRPAPTLPEGREFLWRVAGVRVSDSTVSRMLRRRPRWVRGFMIVMDNLSAHKGSRVREIVEGRGCELMCLPPYSLDFNPIEQAFSKLKSLLRKTGARTRGALVEAMGQALDAVSASDARGFFEHCGYHVAAQLP
jgi:DDE superfamily endonuclease